MTGASTSSRDDGTTGSTGRQASDLFPETESGYLLDAVRGVAPEVASTYVMRVYLNPLCSYFASTSYKRMGPPADVVAGFFADRLARPDWVTRWFEARQTSGMRFSRWILNAFNNYLREEYRRGVRDQRIPVADPLILDRAEAPLGSAQDSVQDQCVKRFERDRAEAVLREAMEMARTRTTPGSRPVDFSLFEDHFLKDMTYAAIAEARGMTLAEVRRESRLATVRLRLALEAVLFNEGITRERMDEEVRLLYEAVR